MPAVDYVSAYPSPLDRPGVCTPWATELTCPLVDTLEGDAAVAMADQLLRFASDVLYDLTRRRWPGVCTDTVWPADVGCPCRCRYDRCRNRVPRADLGPDVISVDEVRVDGAVVDPATYRLVDQRWLIVMTGAVPWYRCQPLDVPDGDPGTWSVTYTRGSSPPIGGAMAAGSLACELGKAMGVVSSAGECRLPKRVTTITRQGVTIAVLDPLTLFKDGLTGLVEVDMWVASVNRGSDQRGGRLIDPARGAAHHRTP